MKNIPSALIDSAKSGNAESFGELYACIWKDLYRFCCYYLGSKNDAEDVVQDTVIEAYKSLPSLKNEASFRGWIFAIATRQCSRQIKKIKQSRLAVDVDDLFDLHDDTEIGRDTEQSVLIFNAISELKDDARSIVLLSVIEGYSGHEIARILNRPESTCRSILFRSLKKMRMLLDDTQTL